MSTPPDVPSAAALDAADELAGFRDRFVIDPDGPVYLDGNSLGRLPVATVEATRRVVEDEWGAGLVTSWDHWFDLPQRVGAVIAGLVGAPDGSVTLADSTTVDLFKLAAAATDALPARRVIVTDSGNFPTDRYALEGVARARDLTVRVVDADPVAGVTADAVADVVDDDVALVSFSHVSYRSGAIADMAVIGEVARSVGALTLWDLSHAVGSVPVDLDGAGADLAVGCTYKYLNGGPGAPAFLFVRPALQGALTQPIWGWFAHESPFDFDPDFRPARGIERFLVGTPPILSTAAAVAGIEITAEAGIDAIRRKSLAATGFLLERYDEVLAPLGVGLASPRDERRGSHVALTHPEGLAISRWLRSEANVVVDFRAPDTIRVAVAPLYTSFAEVDAGVEAIRRAVEGRCWEEATEAGSPVT